MQGCFFRPAVGQVLQGRVTQLTDHHVGCLVAGLFNASIMLEDMADGYAFEEGGSGGGGEWAAAAGHAAAAPGSLLAANPARLRGGEHLVFRVKGLLHNTGVLTILGTLGGGEKSAGAAGVRKRRRSSVA